MRFLAVLLCITVGLTYAEELKIKAESFYGDEKKGISVFKGNVKVTKGYDKLNAQNVTVYIDKEKNPTKFVAVGDVSFRLKTEDGAVYEGVAQKAEYFPKKKEYNFYKNVHLKQLGDKKEIIGDVVVLKMLENKAFAKGAKKEPVIMIFDLKEKQKGVK